MERSFINGFESWHETHYEIVISLSPDVENTVCNKVVCEQGTGGLYQLAKDWTDEFETLHSDREWDGEFYDEIERFITEKNKLK